MKRRDTARGEILPPHAACYNRLMQKTLIAIIALVVIVGLGVYAFLLFGMQGSNAPSATPSDGGFPIDRGPGVTPNSQSGTGTGASVSTVTGNQLSVNDFKNDPATIADSNNAGHYYLSGGVDAGNSNAPYSILYVEADQSFSITLLEEPLADTRIKAETELMQRLGVIQSGMCSLRYVVSTPYWVNEIYAGKNLGFSFCPGATPL